MFAKITKAIGVHRSYAAPARVSAFRADKDACNDNRAVRGLARAGGRAKRDTLACRWRLVPSTGALECVWHAEASSAGEEPALSRRLCLTA
jgi:hypothetical protein